MMNHDAFIKPISINQPMVLIPTEEYRFLLREAGRAVTPILDHEIVASRRRFKKGKNISWKSIQNRLNKLNH